MKKFVYLYSGGSTPSSEVEGKEVMAKWVAYFQMLGDVVVDSGNPFGEHKTAGSASVSKINGYSVVKAANMDDAVMMAEKCPIVADGGGVEVIETIAM